MSPLGRMVWCPLCTVTGRSSSLSSGIVSSSSLYRIYCSIFFSLFSPVSLSTYSGTSSFPSSAESTICWWFSVFVPCVARQSNYHPFLASLLPPGGTYRLLLLTAFEVCPAGLVHVHLTSCQLPR